MRSMTAYASVEKSSNQFSFSVTIKSLNSRYLEIYTHVPRILKNEENEIVRQTKEYFVRGKVEVSIDIFDWVDERTVSFNSNLIKKYYQEIEKVQRSIGADNTFSLDFLFSLDGVLNREKSKLSDKSRNDIFNTLELTIKKALKMGEKEGSSTKKDIQDSLSVINQSTREIKKHAKEMVKNIYEKLTKRVEGIAGQKIDSHRLYAEVAILADKMDINEEVVRLNDHLKKFKTTMGENGQIGKKLDFIAQEMFREINTISSKSNSSSISHLVVEIKNHIDKIREQSRNVI